MAARRSKTADRGHRPTTAHGSARDRRARGSLVAETDRQFDDLIRRRLALPIAARMNFLRRRLPGGGSSL
jgi:hypothetical protein